MDSAVQEIIRTLATFIGAVGGWEGLRRIYVAWNRRRTGKDKRDELQTAHAETDREARKRRIYAETLHETRLVARDLGVPLDKLPPWPTFAPSTAPTPTQQKDD